MRKEQLAEERSPSQTPSLVQVMAPQALTPRDRRLFEKIFPFSRQVSRRRGLSFLVTIIRPQLGLEVGDRPDGRPQSPHPTDQTLHAYGLGKLDDASAESVNKHLESCPTAAAGSPS